MRPMLATKGTHVPTGDEWVHEVKWDGVRMLCDVVSTRSTTEGSGSGGPRCRMFSRNGNDVTIAWPEISDAAAG